MKKFARAQWSMEVEARLTRALRYRCDMEYMRDEVMDGRAELWIVDGGESILITRIEGPELVIVAYEGARARENFKVLWKHCKARGFDSIRIHTQQPWIVAMLRDFHPEPVEQVVRFFINGREEQKRNIYGQSAEHYDEQHAKHSVH